MSLSGNGVFGGAPPKGLASAGGYNPDPAVQAAKDASQEGMQFQLWVSQQASSLSKLKVFHSMAKQVNDQQ